MTADTKPTAENTNTEIARWMLSQSEPRGRGLQYRDGVAQYLRGDLGITGDRMMELDAEVNRLAAGSMKPDVRPVYEVQADAESGEWMGEPERTEETSTLADWFEREDTDEVRFDTCEHFEQDDETGQPSLSSETRLIRVVWQRAEESED